MCLETVHTDLGKKFTIKHLPNNDLIQGWKVMSGVNTPAMMGGTAYYLSGLYYRSLKFKKRWNTAESYPLFGMELLYYSGFHVFADEWAAEAYAEGEGPYTYIVPVYFKKQNIKTSGSQIEAVVYVLDKMYIKPKDFKKTFKQYKKAQQVIR